MKQDFQNAYDAMMKLAEHAKEGAAKFPDNSSFKYTWEEKAEVYKSCANLLMDACTCSGIILKTESNLHPVFDQIFKNLYS